MPANKKISQLTEQTSLVGVEADCYVIIVNEQGENRRVRVSNLPTGSGSGGATALNGLSDVAVSNPQQGDILVYEVTPGTPKFQNTPSLDGGFFN